MGARDTRMGQFSRPVSHKYFKTLVGKWSLLDKKKCVMYLTQKSSSFEWVAYIFLYKYRKIEIKPTFHSVLFEVVLSSELKQH